MISFLTFTAWLQEYVQISCCRMMPAHMAQLLISDTVTALSYFLISYAIFSGLRPHRASLPPLLYWLAMAFSAFILACGSGHFIDLQLFFNNICDLKVLSGWLTAILSAIAAAMILKYRRYLKFIASGAAEAFAAARAEEIAAMKEVSKRHHDAKQ